MLWLKVNFSSAVNWSLPDLHRTSRLTSSILLWWSKILLWMFLETGETPNINHRCLLIFVTLSLCECHYHSGESIPHFVTPQIICSFLHICPLTSYAVQYWLTFTPVLVEYFNQRSRRAIMSVGGWECQDPPRRIERLVGWTWQTQWKWWKKWIKWIWWTQKDKIARPVAKP